MAEAGGKETSTCLARKFKTIRTRQMIKGLVSKIKHSAWRKERCSRSFSLGSGQTAILMASFISFMSCQINKNRPKIQRLKTSQNKPLVNKLLSQKNPSLRKIKILKTKKSKLKPRMKPNSRSLKNQQVKKQKSTTQPQKTDKITPQTI